MKKFEIENVLNIINDVSSHPISYNIVENNGFEKISKQLEEGQYSSFDQVRKDVESMIDTHSANNEYLYIAGNEIKRIFNKKSEVFFANSHSWGIRLAKLRSELSDLSSKPPIKVKQLCELPSIQSVVKPNIPLFTESEVKNLVKLLNSIENENLLDRIKNIIETNESHEVDFSNVNLAKLKPSTLQLISDCLKK